MDRAKLIERLMGIFLDELDQHVATLRDDLRALKSDPKRPDRTARIQTSHRAAHSLKGAARSAGVNLLEAAGREMEHLLADVRDDRLALENEIVELVEKVIDAVADVGARLRAKQDLSVTPLDTLLPKIEARRFRTAPAHSSSAQSEAPLREENAMTAPRDLSEPHHTKRVMVVDDSETNRNLVRLLLEAEGYSVRTATDGVEAMEKLEAEAPDLVVSDVAMPRMDGFGLTQAIRSSPTLRTLPVVLLSGYASEVEKARSAEVGASAYVVKGGMDVSDLLAAIRRLA
jgi:CheY-like chemotaxis protein/HPt (histidine-containing phosphotransfer) domain-containing protein